MPRQVEGADGEDARDEGESQCQQQVQTSPSFPSQQPSLLCVDLSKAATLCLHRGRLFASLTGSDSSLDSPILMVFLGANQSR